MHKTGHAKFSGFLGQIGVAPGDVVMVHSFLPSLGQLEDGLPGICRALRDRLGTKGTLVVPTFTYSFCKGEEFDNRHTPSVAGTFTEFVRCQDGVVRSADPIFSIAAIGDLAYEVTRIREQTCFGPGSVFELLEQAGVKFLLLGTDYQKSLTYFIHLEKSFGVPYREEKLFSGSMVMTDGTRKRGTFSYYVRTEGSGCRMDYNRIGGEFDETSGCRVLRFAYGVHRLIDGAELSRYSIARLRQDAYCLTRSEGKEPESESGG